MTKFYCALYVAFVLFVCAIFFVSCEDDNHTTSDKAQESEDDTILRFVDTDYIELSKITRISRFRSGIGHSYTDDFETCRSMKHYYVPKDDVDATAIKIFSPIDGTVQHLEQEWAGTQIRIVSQEYPTFVFILFHVNEIDLEIGDKIIAGQQIGTHIGSETWSDIAVGQESGAGWRLNSYFDVMADTLFTNYQERGLLFRDDAVISPEARDGDPLQCDEEDFSDSGNIENWVYLE